MYLIIHNLFCSMFITLQTMMRMFIMSVGEFGMFYKNLNDCKSNLAGLGKVCRGIEETKGLWARRNEPENTKKYENSVEEIRYLDETVPYHITCHHNNHLQVFFTLYELIVTIMLLNLLIAMMTRTYEKIAEAQKEWKRQVNGICLPSQTNSYNA